MAVKTRHGSKTGVPRGALPTVMESIPPPVAIALEWVMRAASVVFLCILIYYGYAIGLGDLKNLWHLPLQDQWRVLHNLMFAGRVLTVSGIFLTVYAFLAWYEHTDWFLILVAAFGLLVFGGHFLLFNELAIIPSNAAAIVIDKYLRLVGESCLAVATLRFLLYMLSLLRRGLPDRPAREGLRGRFAAGHERSRTRPFYRLMRRCWETPYCQDFLLAVCPAWQRKMACWKYGSGCMCDPAMMERLIQIEMMPLDSGPRPAGSTGKAPKGSAKCRTCPIYLEHEEEKFRVISPLVPVGSLLAVLVTWDWIGDHYDAFAAWIGRGIAAVALGPSSALARDWMSTFEDPIVKYSLIVLGAIAAMSYLLKFTEWAILEKKL